MDLQKLIQAALTAADARLIAGEIALARDEQGRFEARFTPKGVKRIEANTVGAPVAPAVLAGGLRDVIAEIENARDRKVSGVLADLKSAELRLYRAEEDFRAYARKSGRKLGKAEREAILASKAVKEFEIRVARNADAVAVATARGIKAPMAALEGAVLGLEKAKVIAGAAGDREAKIRASRSAKMAELREEIRDHRDAVRDVMRELRRVC